jgi:hypothetical protein
MIKRITPKKIFQEADKEELVSLQIMEMVSYVAEHTGINHDEALGVVAMALSAQPVKRFVLERALTGCMSMARDGFFRDATANSVRRQMGISAKAFKRENKK